jgi:hypothetical protein
MLFSIRFNGSGPSVLDFSDYLVFSLYPQAKMIIRTYSSDISYQGLWFRKYQDLIMMLDLRDSRNVDFLHLGFEIRSIIPDMTFPDGLKAPVVLIAYLQLTAISITLGGIIYDHL